MFFSMSEPKQLSRLLPVHSRLLLSALIDVSLAVATAEQHVASAAAAFGGSADSPPTILRQSKQPSPQF
jgi:hypothetical protein